jgi:hypothetical protein
MRAVEDTARRYYELITGIPAATIKGSGERSYLTLDQIASMLYTECPSIRR